MQLTFALPSPALQRFIGVYYLLEEEFSLIEDLQRADVGQLRFFLEGQGYHAYANGERAESHPVFLTGPTNSSNRFSITGPLRIVGISLRPEAWGALVPTDAHKLADHATDAVPIMGSAIENLLISLTAYAKIADIAPLLDAWLIRRIKPIRADHQAAIDAIRNWLAEGEFPHVDDLYARSDLSERQMMRIANRYFGAPPKLLARKYGALRTASRIFVSGGAIPDEALTHYADRSHLTREVRIFTGQTPSQLKTVSSRFMRATLSPDNFRELLPAP